MERHQPHGRRGGQWHIPVPHRQRQRVHGHQVDDAAQVGKRNIWRYGTLNTSALVQSGDPAIYGVLTDSQYKVPKVLARWVHTDDKSRTACNPVDTVIAIA